MRWKQTLSIVLTVLAGMLASAIKLQIVPPSGEAHQLAEWGLAVIAIIGTSMLPGIFNPTPEDGRLNSSRGSVRLSLLIALLEASVFGLAVSLARLPLWAFLAFVAGAWALRAAYQRRNLGRVLALTKAVVAITATLALLGLAAPTLLAGCATGAATVAKKIGIDAGTCVFGEVPAVISSLVPGALAAIAGTAAQWATELASLEANGIDVAICIVEAIVHDLRAAPASALREALGPRTFIALDRAEVFLAAHRAQLPDGGTQ